MFRARLYPAFAVGPGQRVLVGGHAGAGRTTFALRWAASLPDAPPVLYRVRQPQDAASAAAVLAAPDCAGHRVTLEANARRFYQLLDGGDFPVAVFDNAFPERHYRELLATLDDATRRTAFVWVCQGRSPPSTQATVRVWCSHGAWSVLDARGVVTVHGPIVQPAP